MKAMASVKAVALFNEQAVPCRSTKTDSIVQLYIEPEAPRLLIEP